ncbi:BURP domain-containing protein 3-like [Typha latifolia]|uniref:BURP domain-containing protein 3-like n=1 Tax=Typha latifolia TaxID=4733 RepID=UPI003C2C8661
MHDAFAVPLDSIPVYKIYTSSSHTPKFVLGFSLVSRALMALLLPLLSFLLLALAVSHAALPPQVYWHSVLPNTPMPSAIADLLTSGTLDEKTTVTVGKGGINVNAGKGKPGGTTVGVSKGGVHVSTGKGKPGGTTVGVGKGGVHVSTGKGKPGGTNVHVTPGGVGVNVGPKGHKKPVIVRVAPGKSPFIYNYAATETQLHDDPNVALFFLEKDLHPGVKMTLHFTKTTSATFLPRTAANSIPFSSAKLPQILNYFSIQPNSIEAEAIKETLLECEEPAAKGEKKYCATSLESMVEFSTSSLGTHNVLAVSTTVGKEETPKQQYTITAGGVQRMAGDELVACHAETYAYAVFYCHLTKSTKAYKVKMVGKDGTAVEAVAVCHTDTAGWNPKHLAFQVLNVKPGSVPICHFLPQDHVVWSRSS